MNNKNNFSFFDWNHPEEIIKISKEWFFYKWEKVEDINKIYERFTEWMTKAEIAENSK